MSLSKDEVKKIADLARLTLSNEELDQYSKDLNQILGYVEQLQELDTSGVEPMVGAIEHQKPLRQDVITESKPEEMLKNAPDSEDTAIKVPQMS